jgi:catecholate siderophore receptor
LLDRLGQRPAVAPALLLMAVSASQVFGPSLRAEAEAELPTIRLDKVDVQTERFGDARYNASSSQTATKTDTALVNVPQSLTIVTQDQMRDQQMTSIGDVVRYVPGVGVHQGENNRDQIVFRGNSSSADFFVNGVRDDVQYFRDVYNLDRVEVLRGPNAMVFGRGGGGGIINRSTKEANLTELHELSLTGGSFDDARATLDLNQPLNPKAAVRLNALWEDSGSFRNRVSLRREGISPTATYLPTERTKITLGYEYLHDRRTADRGITSWQGRPAPVPVELYYGNPDDSHVQAAVNLVSALIEHRTTSNLEIRNRTVFGDYDRGYQNYVPGAVNSDQTLVTLTAYNNATTRRNGFNQTDLTYRLTSGGVQHTLLGGVELGRQLTDNFRNTGYFNNATTSVLVPYASPTIGTPVVFRQSATDADNHLKTDVGAVYAQDQIEFGPHWQAVTGLRFDAFSLQYTNNRTGGYLGRRDNLVSPRAGLIYKPKSSVSIYGSYSVSYLPSSGDQFSSLTTITQQVKPEKFTNYEIGAKFDLSRDVFLSTALYQLDRTNTRATDPNDPTRILQTGSQRSKGFEIGLNGTVTKAWTASAGYAYQDATIRSTTTAAVAGATVAQVPKHSLSLWNKYQIASKLAVGVGVIRRSDVFATVDNSVTLPGYTRVDAGIYYTVSERWRLQVNAENLLDKKYYLNADSNTNISPGSPLAVRASMVTRF